ncbi:MAG TPA: BMP family ABC transporter substrate-binding protein [Chloroflexi bacterium]|jgi:simple sugar transport system substrate-binding protein|nr:BMP family ABC transporter substrate-binding protein [Chloroflexota bacterium]
MLKRRTLWMAMAIVVLASLLTSCASSTAKGEFTFGLVLVGPYNDHGWSEAHYQAGKYVEEKLPGTKMIYLDKLNSADRQGTTLEQVVEDMVSQGADMIFTTSDDFAADTDVVAAKYPDIPFLMISGDHAKTGQAPSNVANYMARMEYTKAIAGCAAALTTETNQIGYLGPLINAETRRLAASAYLGARDCYERYRGGNPDDLRFVVNWIGFWFNIPGVTLDPTEVANDMFNQGIDVLISGIDTTEAIDVAGQRYDKGEQVWAIPYDYEHACDIKPEVCLGTPYFNWGPAYVRYITAAREGKHEQTFEWEGPNWKNLNDPDSSPVGYSFGPALSEENKKTLEDYIKVLADGKSKLFVGPLNYQDGTPFLADGEQADDDTVWNLPQLIEGMEGASS